MPTLLIATTNQNKFREYAAIFAGLPLDLRSLGDIGITEDVEETGTTFAENARLKAEFYAARGGLPALADDSGLEVAALNNEADDRPTAGRLPVCSAARAKPQGTIAPVPTPISAKPAMLAANPALAATRANPPAASAKDPAMIR